jgi:translation initiation factor IF-3
MIFSFGNNSPTLDARIITATIICYAFIMKFNYRERKKKKEERRNERVYNPKFERTIEQGKIYSKTLEMIVILYFELFV